MNWLDEIEQKLKATTPGPWYWRGVKKLHDVALLSTKNGHQTVMDFVRWGMSGAGPRFKMDGVLERIETLASPRQAHRPDGEFYHINHPDAEFIASSPEMVAKLIAAVREMENQLEEVQENLGDFLGYWGRNLKVANWHQNGDLENLDNFIDGSALGSTQANVTSLLAKLQSGDFQTGEESGS